MTTTSTSLPRSITKAVLSREQSEGTGDRQRIRDWHDMLEGQVQYEDFAEQKKTIGPGDLQWVTASRGIVHSGMPGKLQTSALGLQL
ncbi:hypothetical protein F5H01DRAFT_372008 [Linnemannia elongata]|nr:hypothetical protein F5H01DRAFT_372008 [Linnemannia elongata]